VTIQIRFANLDVVNVDADTILPIGTEHPKWSDASIGKLGLYISVPTSSGPCEIPWDVIRNLTHDEFAQLLAEQAAGGSRLLGRQLRKLRERRGLTQRHVATVIGLDPANLSRIENGEFDLQSSTLFKVLSAIGYSTADLTQIKA
jgi:DNA-binding XRE family transcriptional regulator